jgi:hypothetical protein
VLQERGVCRRVRRCASRGMEVQGRQQGCKGERKAYLTYHIFPYILYEKASSLTFRVTMEFLQKT